MTCGRFFLIFSNQDIDSRIGQRCSLILHHAVQQRVEPACSEQGVTVREENRYLRALWIFRGNIILRVVAIQRNACNKINCILKNFSMKSGA